MEIRALEKSCGLGIVTTDDHYNKHIAVHYTPDHLEQRHGRAAQQPIAIMKTDFQVRSVYMCKLLYTFTWLT